MVLDAWDAKVREIDTLIAGLNDEELMMEVAPGKTEVFTS
ncbi:hypothetical protein SAMN04488505_102220 [Chitinophaga rupis]|uniref:Uncharacterized protein n=1 Tax=Chitinophaga rupis TaxID=573321 RepID=A0A1H7Q2J5_9BACT|nr:hypothetical protein SAMN04488505_102220 [Chitinophaga rupis]